ncbi:MAG: aminopeptidase P family protein [Candidatus Hydrogenedentes bacterium]|nr:aminopeptidase P family protein [Candidatus Hydrogenedentota bacterium]
MTNSILKALREGLAKAECDAFCSIAPPTNQYLAGFKGTTSAVIITKTHAVFLCDFRYTEQASQQVKGYEIHEVAGSLPARVGEWLDKLGVKTAAFEPGYLTVADFESIQKNFEGALKPVSAIVSDLRQIKSPDEIERIRAASALAEGVLADLTAALDAGVTERDLAAEFEYEFKRRGASGASFDTIALFGPRSSLPHGAPGDTPLARGDIVLLDFGCRLDGYCSDLTRTFAFGTIPSPWFDEVYELTLTAQTIALEAIRPGKTGREVDAVARDLIAEAGFGPNFGHGLGHGVGIEIHEGPRLNKESDTVLVEGMVITVEPGIYVPGKGGVRIEDLVVVTKDGCELLSAAPKELKVLGR